MAYNRKFQTKDYRPKTKDWLVQKVNVYGLWLRRSFYSVGVPTEHKGRTSGSMVYGLKRGFTLIELVMMMAIIGILAGSGTYLMLYLVQNSVFLPNKMNMDMLAAEAVEIMVDGDKQAKGLRFSRAVSAIQDYQVTFINQDAQNIVYRLDTPTNKLYRSINGAAETAIPYYANPAGINMEGKNNRLFTYYDASEVVTANPANVRWMTMTLIAKTGSGSSANWQGQSEQSVSIAVKKFQ